MKGFYIEVTNNLLEKKHRKQMGTSVWEFLWCLDKITIIKNSVGILLGGRPVKLEEIESDLGITKPKISKNLNKLKNLGYIDIKIAPYGIIISVNKAKKRFAQKVKPILPKRVNLVSLRANLIRQDSRQDSNTKRTTRSHKNMYIHDENNPDRGRILNEDGEVIAPAKKETPEKNKFWAFAGYFKQQALKHTGVDPEISGTGAIKVFKRVRDKYTKEQLIDIIDFYFTLDKSKEHLSIFAALSDDTITKWKMANKI